MVSPASSSRPHGQSRRRFLQQFSAGFFGLSSGAGQGIFSQLGSTLPTPLSAGQAVTSAAPIAELILSSVASRTSALTLVTRLVKGKFDIFSAPFILIDSSFASHRVPEMQIADIEHFEFAMSNLATNLARMSDKGASPLISPDPRLQSIASVTRPHLFPGLELTPEQVARFAEGKPRTFWPNGLLASHSSPSQALGDYVGATFGNAPTPAQLAAWEQYQMAVADLKRSLAWENLPGTLHEGSVSPLHRLFSPQITPAKDNVMFADAALSRLSDLAGIQYDVHQLINNPPAHAGSFIWKEFQKLGTSSWRHRFLTNLQLTARASYVDAIENCRLHVQLARMHPKLSPGKLKAKITAELRRLGEASSRLKRLGIRIPTPLKKQLRARNKNTLIEI